MNPNSLAVQGHHGDVAGTVTAKWAKGLGRPAGDETQNMVAFDCKGSEVQHDTVAPPLRAMGHAGSHTNGGGHAVVAIQERAVSENPDAGPDGKGVRDDDTAFTLEARTQPQAVAFKPSHYTRGKDGAPSQVFPPLTADADKGDQGPVIACDGTIDGPVPPLMARSSRGGAQTLSPGHQTDGHCIGLGPIVRRLTPVECARLQGFPDNHCQVTYRGRAAADGPQYKAYGNSMAVPVVAWILDRVRKAVEV